MDKTYDENWITLIEVTPEKIKENQIKYYKILKKYNVSDHNIDFWISSCEIKGNQFKTPPYFSEINFIMMKKILECKPLNHSIVEEYNRSVDKDSWMDIDRGPYSKDIEEYLSGFWPGIAWFIRDLEMFKEIKKLVKEETES